MNMPGWSCMAGTLNQHGNRGGTLATAVQMGDTLKTSKDIYPCRL